jgi:hypothetical protein
MKRILAAIILLLTGYSLRAQHQELNEKPGTWNTKEASITDSTSILHAFRQGNFNGSFRYFFMATDNATGLTDYYANAAGGGLRFETAKFHGFQFAISGYYIFNVGSSDLGITDSITGLTNRYEIGLFDLEDPDNKKDIDRLEEFYLKYNYKKSSLLFGRQLLNTPFINLQDGRMRPTEVEGIYAEINEINKLKIEGGWLYSISPRSTTKWYRTANSIGIYATGVNPDGSKSQYKNNLTSTGVFIFGTNYQATKNLKLQVWDVLIDNILNTAMLQADWQPPAKNNSAYMASAQLIRQDAVENGGNDDPNKTYAQKGSVAMTFGLRAGWKSKKLEAVINYNQITSKGRYLMPREWGRDPFFTFLPRERNEGLGDAQAIMIRASYTFSKQLKTSLAAGYYELPDVKNYALNKYGFPSYTQINGDVRFAFNGVLKGLEMQALVAGKINRGETYGNNRYTFNKVAMVNYNLVLNYLF